VRMLLGLVHPTAGRVALLGRPMPRDAAQVLPRVGALVEGPAAWPHLSGRTNLKLFDAAGRSGRRDRADRVEEALVRVGLGGIDGRPVRAYSLGMRQRLGIAAAILRKPELLLLDEPTNGLDPRGIGEMRGLLRHFAAQGTTVVLSSHLLSEVEALCTRVGVMSAGRLVLTADLDTLRAPTGLVQVRTPDPAAAVGVLDGRVVHRDGDLVMVRADDPAALNARLVAAGVAVHELTALRRTLEQVVLELTGPSADRVDRVGAPGQAQAGADATARRRRVGRGRAADDRRIGRADDDASGRTDDHATGRSGGRGTGRTDDPTTGRVDGRGTGRADDRGPGADRTDRADGSRR
jgi:ABC-type multidrug transport system ATPase subunit